MKVRFYVHRYFLPAYGVIEDTYNLSRIAHLIDAPNPRFVSSINNSCLRLLRIFRHITPTNSVYWFGQL